MLSVRARQHRGSLLALSTWCPSAAALELSAGCARFGHLSYPTRAPVRLEAVRELHVGFRTNAPLPTVEGSCAFPLAPKAVHLVACRGAQYGKQRKARHLPRRCSPTR